jgi:hypothetical protein
MDDRSEYRISKEDALKRLDINPDYDQGDGPQPHVHTIRQGGPMLVGANWTMDQVEKAIDKYGIEEAGEEAEGMGHGLVLIDDAGPVFFATKKSTTDEEE